MATTPAIPAGYKYCPNCQRTKKLEDGFYSHKDGTKAEFCKECLTMHINNWEPETFLPVLQQFDVPYIEGIWNKIRDAAYAKNPNKMTPMSVFGKYLSQMKLKQHKDETWADTERIRIETEMAAKQAAADKEAEKENKRREMETYLQQGLITQEQYDEYIASTTDTAPRFEKGLTPEGKEAIFALGEAPFESVEIPDISKELTPEEKTYLALKWGRLYTPAEWLWLEKKYYSFAEDYGGIAMFDEARKDSLLFICKTSLKMNNALDCGDIDTYQKLSKVYEGQTKAGKFTEAQKKEEKEADYDAIGQIVLFCEKHGGYIPPHDISIPFDIVDRDIKDMKAYTKSLIEEDPTVFKQIEQFIKKREAIAEAEEDLAKAKAEGFEEYELTDEDFKEYQDNINKQLEEDMGEDND